MNLRRLIAQLLAVLVIAGLIAAPLVTPAAAMGLSGSGMGGTASMSGDMPCCPDHQKSNDCHDCPIVAMCISTFVQAAPAISAAILIRQPIRVMLFALDDTISDGLDRPPPDHPPRTLV
ncbi:hypothetical protein [Bradyrhizobium betae]|jgi:hypothetical protein|uniref:DUF2946 domain-containing protein n=1 Tax=Bradyrhizobium betae TaxID=244734 RepID=A0A5P6PGP4_9BRAD|nr:hypothetical protein [Bradyrhizobium betae]MCS3731017.1 hypothetical protein [Bradyrhizobium betae]QFI77455.1 hypothetical protein F8237_34590 [Bradyrhizobium betae]